VDGTGVPLALVVSGANVPDIKGLAPTLEAVQYTPASATDLPVLCADRGYWGYEGHYTSVEHGYLPQIFGFRQDRYFRRHDPTYKRRRWIVEACHSWMNRYRKLLTRFEKTARAYYGLFCFAAANLIWNRVISR
jgi:putative transposase